MLQEISLLTQKNNAETISDALLDVGVFSVSIEDADANSEQENPIYGEPGLEPDTCAWENSRLKVLIDETFPLATHLEAIAKKLGCPIPSIDTCQEVPDNDWVRITQAQFTPTCISPRLWIVPTWHELPNPNALNIRLDPGVAFGTGTHPTTRLCLMWLDSNLSREASVLDYGCGSGILAVAAKKLGATSAIGTDIDPQAVESATLNASANDVKAEFYVPENMPEGKFDVVVANILSNPLKVLAPALLARVSSGGHLVLSGILERQAQEIISIYAQYDSHLPLAVWKAEDGWVCLAGKRNN